VPTKATQTADYRLWAVFFFDEEEVELIDTDKMRNWPSAAVKIKRRVMMSDVSF
jgi:hypothetical protein